MGIGPELSASIGSLYERAIIDTGKQPELLFFVAFLCTFSFIRSSAHLIRAEVSWWPGNVQVGGTHIHHLVWGICILLAVGWVGVTQDLSSPASEIVAIGFGIGAGLTLDEFALWLTLRDVYWEQEGRRSIDAVILVTAAAGVLLVGFRAWVDVGRGVEASDFHLVGWSGLIAILAIAANLAKEKYGVALIGVALPLVAVVGSFRLGRPSSLWARGYSEDKRRRAASRFAGRSLRPLPPRLDRSLQRRRQGRREDWSQGAESSDSEGGSP